MARPYEQTGDTAFHRAVELLDAGDAGGLRSHLLNHPALVHQRVAFDGGDYFLEPTLLEFVAANPIRHDRVPASIVEVARVILDAAQDSTSEASTQHSLWCPQAACRGNAVCKCRSSTCSATRRWGLEEEWDAEAIAVELDRAGKVFRVHRDLADRGQEFPTGPFVLQARLALAGFYSDLFKVVRWEENGEPRNYKFDCFHAYIDATPLPAQRRRALELAVRHYAAVTQLLRNVGHLADELAALRAGRSDQWHFCAD